MQGSSNNSFIPKRRHAKRQRSKPGRKVFLITILAYSLLFAALLAALGVVFYKNYVTTQLENEVLALDGEVNTFSVQNFKRVQEFDSSLQKTQNRVDNTVSVTRVLDELDRITAQPIQINNLEFKRRGDQDLQVMISFSTETLDGALFQRKVLNANSSVFSSVKISEIDIQDSLAVVASDLEVAPVVVFLAEFSIPLGSVLYDPLEARLPDVGVSQSNSPQNLDPGSAIPAEDILFEGVENNEIII